MLEKVSEKISVSCHNDSGTLPEVGEPGVIYILHDENGKVQQLVWNDGEYCQLWLEPVVLENIRNEEFYRLVELLAKKGIDFHVQDCLGGKQVVGYHDGVRYWDVVIHPYSYGYESGLLEMMGPMVLTDDCVKGYLTAEDCVAILDGTYKWWG